MVNINIEIENERHKKMKVICVENNITIEKYINALIQENIEEYER